MIKLIKEVKLFNAGYVQLWNFNEANASEENRIEAVTTVANVCRGDKGVKNPKELYQQLLTEHDGKPGSVFEFVPASIEIGHIPYRITKNNTVEPMSIAKHGTRDGFTQLTNLRSLLEDGMKHYNVISPNGFFVFKIKVPQMIVKHILRHRMLSFQECSERTNKLREYYYCDELKSMYPYLDEFSNERWNEYVYDLSQSDLDFVQRRYKIRQELLNKGSHGLAYTTLWIAGWKQDSLGWDNFFAVRTKKPAQREVIELANVIKEMMEG